MILRLTLKRYESALRRMLGEDKGGVPAYPGQNFLSKETKLINYRHICYLRGWTFKCFAVLIVKLMIFYI